MPTEVKGALELRKALRDFAPDLLKETNKEIASFIKPVVSKARGYMPSNEDAPSGWLKRPNAAGRWAERFYDQAAARKGIGFKSSPSKENRRGWVSLASIYNRDYGGAIYETAGRKSGNTGNFTPRLEGQLKGRNQKTTGRAIFRAYAEDQGKANAGVIKAIEKASDKFNRRTR